MTDASFAISKVKQICRVTFTELRFLTGRLLFYCGVVAIVETHPWDIG